MLIFFAFYAYLSQIVKADIHTKKTVRWTEADCYPSEPVFVEAPDAVDEDDGKNSVIF